jgi:hypothetical protein
MERPHQRATTTAFAVLLASLLAVSVPASAGLTGDTVSVNGRIDSRFRFVTGNAIVSDTMAFDLCTDLDVRGTFRQRLQIDFPSRPYLRLRPPSSVPQRCSHCVVASARSACRVRARMRKTC